MTDVEEVLPISADEVLQELNEEAQHEANVARITDTLSRAELQLAVFNLLKDKQWHCREHEGKLIAGGQYAGGGGIKGLRKNTKSRLGLVIEAKSAPCPVCKKRNGTPKKTNWDRWTGEEKSTGAASSIPKSLIKRILHLYHNVDVIEQRERDDGELVVEHRFPMIR